MRRHTSTPEQIRFDLLFEFTQFSVTTMQGIW